jgi:Flp pilus assembly protein CpaB
MPLQRRTTPKAAPAAPAGGGSAPRKQSSGTMTIGLLLGAVSAALIFVLLTGLSQKTSILVAKQDIPPYSTVSQAMLQTETVAKSSVTQYDLTPSQFSSNKTFVNRVEILPGQRVDSRALSPATDGSLQAVKPGEVAVAVTTTLAAVVGGAVLPGDVVDVYSVNGGQTSSGAASSSSGLLVSDAKVIGVGYGPDATASLLPTGDKPLNGKTSSSASQNVVVILAVEVVPFPVELR